MILMICWGSVNGIVSGGQDNTMVWYSTCYAFSKNHYYRGLFLMSFQNAGRQDDDLTLTWCLLLCHGYFHDLTFE